MFAPDLHKDREKTLIEEATQNYAEKSCSFAPSHDPYIPSLLTAFHAFISLDFIAPCGSVCPLENKNV